MRNELSTDVDYLSARLVPLIKEGKPVALQLFTPYATGKRKDPLLLFTPGTSYGWSRERVVVSVIDQGSAIIHLETRREYNRREKKGIEFRPRIADCVRAGIPAKLATILVTTLQQLVLQPKEKQHGTSSTPHRTGPSSRPRTPRKYTPFRSA